MIIGLVGHASSGKDEAAQALQSVGFERRAFADPIKKLLYLTDSLSAVIVDEYNGWDDAKRVHAHLRHQLQKTGVALLEAFGPDVLIDHALGDYTPGMRLVIPDVRTVEEANTIRELGGLVVRILRPGTTPANKHPLETGIRDIPINAVIMNDRSIQQLHQQIIDIAQTGQTFKDLRYELPA